MKVIRNVTTPIPPPATYDIIGLTETEFTHIKRAVGGYPDSDSVTKGAGMTIYRALVLNAESVQVHNASGS